MKNYILFIVSIFAQLSLLAQDTVIDYRKISNLEGNLGHIISEGDMFGRSIDSIGDIDLDGTTDIIVSAYADDEAGNDIGALYVLRLERDKTIKAMQKISKNIGGFTGDIEIGDHFGICVTAIGDINNDGFTDIAVGSEYDDDGGEWNGAIYLLMLDSTGYVIDHKKISALEGGFSGILSNKPAFGSDIANIGDLNNDGVNDLAVGSRRDNDGGTRLGAVWILFMNSDGTVNHQQKISDQEGNFYANLQYEDFFGGTVEYIGDINNDGYTEIAVGARNDDDGGENTGAVYIISLEKTGIVRSYQKISASQGNLVNVLSEGGSFGSSISKIADLNNDGVVDLAVGAFTDSSIEANMGAVYILYLNSNGTVQKHIKISEDLNGFKGDLDPNDNFGLCVASVGKINDHNTLLIGARLDDDGEQDAGAFYILCLKDESTSSINLQGANINYTYSNPVEDVMILITEEDNTNFKVYDIEGKLIHIEKLYQRNNQIDLSKLKTGTYIGELSKEQINRRFTFIAY
jgi:hypothetical protein